MKITFIGTSHGVPERDRKWTSVMICVGENTYVIDAGASVADGIIRAGRHLDSLRAVFITHQHGDHMNGLPALTDIISWYYKNSDPAIFLPNEGIAEPLTSLTDYCLGGHIRDIDYRVTHEGVIYDEEGVRVTAIPTKHISGGKFPSFAFLFEAEGKKVLFTGDLSHSCEDYPSVAFEQELDLTVTEAAHFKLTQREDILSKTKTKKMYISHFYYKQNGDETEKFAADMPFEVVLAEDGMSVEI